MTIPLQGLDLWESQGEGRMEGYVGAADPEAHRSDSLSGEGSLSRSGGWHWPIALRFLLAFEPLSWAAPAQVRAGRDPEA